MEDKLPFYRTTISFLGMMRREIGRPPKGYHDVPYLYPWRRDHSLCIAAPRMSPSSLKTEYYLVKENKLPTVSHRECRDSSRELMKCYKRITGYYNDDRSNFNLTRDRFVVGIRLRGRENFPNDPDYVERLTNELDRVIISSNIEMEKALHAPTHDRINESARVPCACCNDMIIHPPEKRRLDILVCGCPSHPLICGPCRNGNVRCICLWCNKPGFCRSIKSRQKALKTNSLAKRWETFRTDHPNMSPLTNNWCNFARYDHLRQKIQETIHGFAKMFGLTD